jgi:hypothetical protein
MVIIRRILNSPPSCYFGFRRTDIGTNKYQLDVPLGNKCRSLSTLYCRLQYNVDRICRECLLYCIYIARNIENLEQFECFSYSLRTGPAYPRSKKASHLHVMIIGNDNFCRKYIFRNPFPARSSHLGSLST